MPSLIQLSIYLAIACLVLAAYDIYRDEPIRAFYAMGAALAGTLSAVILLAVEVM